MDAAILVENVVSLVIRDLDDSFSWNIVLNLNIFVTRLLTNVIEVRVFLVLIRKST